MRHVLAWLCLIATLVAPLLRQTGAAGLIARAVETADPAESDDDLEAPVEETDDGEEAALRLSGRRDVLSNPKTTRLSWVQPFPPGPPAGCTNRAARFHSNLACCRPCDRHAWLQVFLF